MALFQPEGVDNANPDAVLLRIELMNLQISMRAKKTVYTRNLAQDNL